MRCDPFGLPAAVLRDKVEFLTAANLTVVAPSLWIAGQARESALFRSCPRIEVIPNGIDTQVFRPRPQREARAALGVPVEGNYLLCGANHGEEKRKGFDLLTRVLREAVHDPRFLRAGARVLWVGEPPAALACSDLPLTRLGRVAEEERMALAYAAADLFVLPSLEDNLPNMLLEALSSATPVVAFAVGGIPEVVRDGVNGRLVPVGDEREMAEAVLSLVADPQLRRTLGEHGRALVCEKYTSSVQATRHLELYRSLIHATAMTVAPRCSPPGQSHLLTPQHGSTDPGPAVGSLLEDLKIHCLREEMHGLQRQAELIAKEQVIRSHIVYRRFSVLYWLRRPVHYLRFGIASKIRRLYEQVFPLAKVFHQYPPKPLQIPDHYHKVPVFDHASRPLVSIVTPSFNHGQFLERTMQSVLQQNYPNLEYIVQDGGSTDGTVQILEKYRTKLKSAVSRPDGGQANAINLGFQHASGEIMAWLNSDDLLLPGTVSYVARYFLEHPDVDVVYGHRINIDENDQEIGRWIMPAHDDELLRWADFIPQETLFWRTRIWQKVGASLDESFQFALDWDLLLRFQDAGAKFARLPRFLGAFRVHAAQKTQAAMDGTGQAEMNRLRLRCHGRGVTWFDLKRHTKSYLFRSTMLRRLHRAGLLNI